ncbi:MAG: rhodanese-like domain-containing protein [Acidimicrobiaceae bacterium]|nr:rhodanese-like domain-containing protein [Acidimicrobiaceae bacterium]
MVTEVDVWSFSAALADGALVLDVREPFEYVGGHVPGARLVPLSTLSTAASELPTGRPIYVICQSGNRSRSAAQELARHGRDARSVSGGTSGWISAGRPVVRGPRENNA